MFRTSTTRAITSKTAVRRIASCRARRAGWMSDHPEAACFGARMGRAVTARRVYLVVHHDGQPQLLSGVRRVVELLRSPVAAQAPYLFLTESDFDRAGEDAWLVGLAYDFERLGLRGLSAFFNFAPGTGAWDPATGQARPDEREFDLTVDYGVESGGNTQTEVRLILNYAFPVL